MALTDAIEVHVYSKLNPNTLIEVLNGAIETTVLSELRGLGGGMTSVSITDPKILANPKLLDYRNFFRIKIDGRTVGAFVAKKRKTDIVGKTTSVEVYTFSGGGPLEWLKDASVYPERGLKASSHTKRSFNFSSMVGSWYDPAKWQNVVSVLGLYPKGLKWERWPQRFPRIPNVKWIWSSAGTGQHKDQKVGFNYFRGTFNITKAGKHQLLFGADDIYKLYVDGQLIAATDITGNGFHNVQQFDLDLTAGEHIIGLEVWNFGGPAGLIAALYRGETEFENDTTSKEYVKDLVWATGRDNAMWKVLPYPKEPPGWTAGEVMLKLINEAKARNVKSMTWLTPTFTATADSNGKAWDTMFDWSFNVGEDLYDVIEQLQELTCEAWVDPDTLELHMVQNRGVDRSAYRFSASTQLTNSFLNADGVQTIEGSTGVGLRRFAIIAGGTHTYREVDRAVNDFQAEKVAVFTRSSNQPVSFGFETRWQRPARNVSVQFKIKSQVATTITLWATPNAETNEAVRTQIGSSISLAANTVTTISRTFVTPATEPDQDWSSYVVIESATGTAGQTFELGDVLVVLDNTATNHTFFSGSTANTSTATHAWTGEVGNSASMRTTGVVSGGAIVLQRGKDLAKATIDGVGDIKNHLLVRTEDSWFEQKGGSYGEFGRIEGKLNTNANVTLSRSIASEVFKQRQLPDESATYVFVETDGQVPFVNFGVGDWVIAPDASNRPTKRRIVSISAADDETGQISYDIEFDSVRSSNDSRIQKWISRDGGGSIGTSFANAESGISNPQGRPVIVEPTIPVQSYPLAPGGLSGTSSAVWDAQGLRAVATVVLTWLPVLANTDGSITEPAYYEIELTTANAEAPRVVATVPGVTATIERLPVGELQKFRVRAFNSPEEAGEYTAWYEITTPIPNTPMAAPDAPTLTSKLGVIVVSWNGLLNGNIPPAQFRYVFAEFSTDNGSTYTRMGPAFQRDTRSITVAENFTVGSTVRVRLRAVDGLNLSTNASGVASIVVEGIDVIDLGEEIADKIDEAYINAGDVMDRFDALDLALDALPGATTGAKIVDINTRLGQTDQDLDALGTSVSGISTSLNHPTTGLAAVNTNIGTINGSIGTISGDLAKANQDISNAFLAVQSTRDGRTWNQDTQPPSGAVYTWAGSANNSQSVEVTNGTETRRNLALSPLGISYGSNDNGAIWNFNRNADMPAGHPQGITKGWKGWLLAGQTSDRAMSAYNVDGLAQAGPNRWLGVWVYATYEFEARFDNPQAWSQAYPANTWVWVTAPVAATYTNWSGLVVRKKGGANVTPVTDIVYATGIMAQAAAAGKPTDTVWGDRPDDRQFDTWINTTNGANTPHYWAFNNQWTNATDKVAKDAATAAATAQSAAEAAQRRAEAMLGDNMIPDGSFERGMEFWAGSGTADTTQKRTGTTSLRMESNGTIRDVVPLSVFPTTEGVAEKFFVEAWVKSNGAALSGQVQLAATTRDASNAATYPVAATLSPGGISSTSWTRISGVIEVPANSVSVQPRLSIRNNVASGLTLWWDDVSMRRVSAEALQALTDAENARLAAVAAANAARAVTLRGENLVSNGSGELGDKTNWSTSSLAFQPQLAPPGFPGAFEAVGTGAYTVFADEKITIDPTSVYRFQATLMGPVGQRHYLALAPYDLDGNVIQRWMADTNLATKTTLAADLVAGATTVTLTNGAAWPTTAMSNHYIGLWPYVNGKGQTFQAEDGYTRNGIRIHTTTLRSGNTLTLNAAHTGATIPAGTTVTLNVHGSNYIYPDYHITTSTVEKFEGLVGGGISPNWTSSGVYGFWPGTAQVIPGLLLNNGALVAGKSGFTGMRLINDNARQVAETRLLPLFQSTEPLSTQRLPQTIWYDTTAPEVVQRRWMESTSTLLISDDFDGPSRLNGGRTDQGTPVITPGAGRGGTSGLVGATGGAWRQRLTQMAFDRDHGYVAEAWVRLKSGETTLAGLAVDAKAGSANFDGYYVLIDSRGGATNSSSAGLQVRKADAGSGVNTVVGTAVTIANDTWYRVTATVTATTLIGRVYNEAGTLLATTATVSGSSFLPRMEQRVGTVIYGPATVDSFSLNGKGWAVMLDAAAQAAAQRASDAMSAANIAQSSANGKNRIINSSVDAFGTSDAISPYIAGDVWWKWANNKVSKQWFYTGSAWSLAEIEHTMIASIDIGKGVFGELDGQYIKAGTIATSRMIVGDFTNLIDNGGFGFTGLDGWNSGVGTVISDVNFRSGKALQSTTNGSYQSRYQTRVIRDVKPGDQFFVEATFYAIASNMGFSLRMLFRDTAGQNLPNGNLGFGNATTDGTYVTRSSVFTAPAGSAMAAIWVEHHAPTGTQDARIGDLVVRRMTGSTLIENGAITTGKIAADQIEGQHIKSTTISVRNLIVSDFTNLIENPDATGTTGWYSSTFAPLASSFYVNADKEISFTSARPDIFGGSYIPVKPGDQFYFAVDARAIGTLAGTPGGFRIRNQADSDVASFNITPTTTKTRYSFVYTVPSNVTAIRFRYATALSGGEIRIGNIEMRRMNGGELIVDGAIKAAHLQTDSVTSGKIQSDAIEARHIKAGQVSTSKLLITDIENYAFDLQNAVDRADFPAVTGNSYSYVNDSAISYGGTRAPWVIKFGPTTVDSPTQSIGSRFAVRPGEKIFTGFWARRDSANVGIRLNLRVLDAVGTTVAWDTAAVTASTTQTNATWAYYSGQVTIPANGYMAEAQIKMASATDQTGTWYVFDPQVRRTATGELIVDGTIAGRHIQAGSISTDKLTVGDFTNLATISELVPGSMLSAASPGNVYGSETQVVNGWVDRISDAGSFFMFTHQKGPVPFESGDQLLFQFDAYVASGGALTAYPSVWVYGGSNPMASGAALSLTTTAQTFTRVVTVPAYDRSVTNAFIIGLSNVAGRDVRVARVSVRRMTGVTMIQDGAITTEKIFAGAVTTNSLAARAVSAEKLLIGDFTNLIENADFTSASSTFTAPPTTGIEGWTLTLGAVTCANTTGLPGRAIVFSGLPEAAVQNNRLFEVTPSLLPPLIGPDGTVETPAELAMPEYYIQAKVRNDRTTPSRISVTWYDQNKVAIANSDLELPPTPSGTWVTYSGTTGRDNVGSVPDAARFGRVSVATDDVTANASSWVGDIIVRRKNGAELIVDGSIYGRHLRANIIESQHLRTGSVLANHIEAGQISVGHIDTLFGTDLNIGGNLVIKSVRDDIVALDQKTSEELAKQAAVYRFDAEAAKIAREGSPYQVWVSNDKISIRENGVEVSHWNSGQLHVDDAVLNRVILVNHQLETTGDNTGTVVRAIQRVS